MVLVLAVPMAICCERCSVGWAAYFNQWRPHRSIGQRAPCSPAPTTPGRQSGTVVATPVLGGLHHVYQIAA